MYLEKATEATEELVSAVQHMAPQLGIHIIPSAREELASLLNLNRPPCSAGRLGAGSGRYDCGITYVDHVPGSHSDSFNY